MPLKVLSLAKLAGPRAPASVLVSFRNGLLQARSPQLELQKCRASGQAATHVKGRARQSQRADEALHVKVDPAMNLPIVIPTNNVPVLLYAPLEEVEEDAVKQLIRVAESPMPVGFVSAMPDVHLGKGVTIGTVFASEKYVCPNAVGVDIGCGMCAVPFQGLHKDDLNLEGLQQIQARLKQRIPTGFNRHSKAPQGARQTLDEISHEQPPSRWLEAKQAEAAVAQQLGTLGGGNHFLEVVYDEEGRVWIMLHSGSRNVGNVTAQHYDGIAAQVLKAQGMDSKSSLNYLEIESADGCAYLQDMEWCQGYAMENRRYMQSAMVEAVNEVTGALPDMEHSINIHHNYCSCERCSYQDPRSGELISRELWVTRKGATSAKAGQYGIIPGSMGVGSYITRGKGDPQSWSSSSHGAGRKMSRTRAVKEISQTAFEDVMAGVVCDTHPDVRDEAPQAYKDLSQVMANQETLVDIVHHLKPLLNVKGFGKGGGGWQNKKRSKGQGLRGGSRP